MSNDVSIAEHAATRMPTLQIGERPASLDYSAAFPKPETIWFDTAAQSPLPYVAADAAMQALSWEARPESMPSDADVSVPRRLKAAIASLIGGQLSEIVLGNSATYGLNLLAQSLALKAGDEVLLVDGDFPSTVLPWLPLASRGIQIRLIKPANQHLSVDDIRTQFTSNTKVFAVSWVNSFTGAAIDLDAVGQTCRSRGVTFILNASQAVGGLQIDVSRLPVDALVSCGQKWLCGPNGTGFCWISAELRDRLDLVQVYYRTAQAANGATTMRDYRVADGRGAAGMDVFGYGHFMPFGALAAAVDLLCRIGPAEIERHNRGLATRIAEGLNPAQFALVTPQGAQRRSSIVVFNHRNGKTDDLCAALTDARVRFSMREGNVRLAPHFFNTAGEVDEVLAVLNGLRS